MAASVTAAPAPPGRGRRDARLISPVIARNLLVPSLVLFHHGKRKHRAGRSGTFRLLANSTLVARIPSLGLRVARAHFDVLPATAITLIAAIGARFVVADRFTYLARPGRRTGLVPEVPVAEVQ